MSSRLPLRFAQGVIVLLAALVSHPLPAAEAELGIAQVRQVPAINGGATVEGGLHVMSGGAITLNGGATITQDLLVPGTPVVRINGKPNYGGTVEGAGPATPSNYTITLNGQATLRHVVRRTAPVALPPVPPPPAPAGARNVTLNSSGQSVGAWSTLRNLTLNGNVGQIVVPPGTYGDFIANGGSGFTLGISGSTTPAVYNLRRLTLNGQARIEVVGPVTLNLADGLAANGAVGSVARPDWLALNIASGGLTLNGGCTIHAFVAAPAAGTGTVIINGNSVLVGGLVADKLVVNGGGLLRLRPGGGSGPVNTAPVAAGQSPSTPEDTPFALTLSATDAENDPLAYRIVALPAHGVLTLADGAPLPPVGAALPAATLRYTPAADYHGPDAFTFHARDAAGLESNVATISITIAPVNDAPSATPLVVRTPEDTPIAITLAGHDPEGSALTYVVAAPPIFGSLSGEPPALTFHPAPNFVGETSFTYTVTDLEGAASTPVNVIITVDPVNDAPVAQPQALELREDESLLIQIAATDAENDPLVFRLVTRPAHGALTLPDGSPLPPLGDSLPASAAGVVRYVPGANFHGADSFTFLANDGVASSAPAAIELVVRPANDAPVAQDGEAIGREDQPLTIELLATDADGDSLIYTMVTPPVRGTLTLSSNQATYVPAADFFGDDSFTFTASDGEIVSAPAIVTITILPENDAPQAETLPPQTTFEDTPLPLTLHGTDPDGDVLRIKLLTPPARGVLALAGGGALPSEGTLMLAEGVLVIYTPTTDYHGPDGFEFSVFDSSGAESAPVSVSIHVTPVNDAPIADSADYAVNERETLSLVLSATDGDGDGLAYALTSQPNLGTLTGTPPTLIYTPPANTDALVEFTFFASDGRATSAPATIRIEVRNLPDAPVAQNQMLTLAEDTTLALTLEAADPDGDELVYEVLVPPAHGTLTGTAPTLIYTPNANFHGADSFSFVARDASLESAPGVITLVVTPVNDAPVAVPQQLTTPEDTSLPVSLSGSDIDQDSLTFSITTAPAHGTLTYADGTPVPLVGSATSLAPSDFPLLYTPAPGYTGEDSFAFVANDAELSSAPALVTITMTPVNQAPVATPQTLVTPEEVALPITLTATDSDGDALTFLITTLPVHGTLTLADGSPLPATGSPLPTPPSLLYTPVADFNGSDEFAFVAEDTSGARSAAASAAITVLPVNDAPDFTAAPPPPVTHADGGLVEINSWATGSVGPANESHQTISFEISGITDPEIFTTLPTVDSTGTLRFTVGPNILGESRFAVVARDDGGTAHGGVDSSQPREFRIVVAPPARAKRWTTTGDFLSGELFNVTAAHDTAFLATDTRAFNFLWVPISSKGTIVRIDADTGTVLGEYATAPTGHGTNPSRTAVDHDGSVWVGNRDSNTVTRIRVAAPFEAASLTTSRGLGHVLPWTNAGGADQEGGVSTVADDLITHYVRVRGNGVRHVSINRDGNLWVGGTGLRVWDLLDGKTGEIIRQEPSIGWGGYGGLIDSNDILWSTRPLMRWDTKLPITEPGAVTTYDLDSYGIALDPWGNVWVPQFAAGTVAKFAPSGQLLGLYRHGSHRAQGVVVDHRGDVWVAHSLLGSYTVGHLKNDGTYVGKVNVGADPTGVAVDAKGRVWAMLYGGVAKRIDPSAGPLGADGVTPIGAVDLQTSYLGGKIYAYADMSGTNITADPGRGVWSAVFDSGLRQAAWAPAAWSVQTCNGSVLNISVALSEDGVNFGPDQVLELGDAAITGRGRYIRVKAEFFRASTGESPVLDYIEVGTLGHEVPAFEPDFHISAGEDVIANWPDTYALRGGVCSNGWSIDSAATYRWEQISGPGVLTIAEPGKLQTHATASIDGNYVVRLTVELDGASYEDTLEIRLTPFNRAPWVDTGRSIYVADATGTVRLEGTARDDGLPLDATMSITWRQVHGPGTLTFIDPSSPVTDVIADQPGIYVLEITATDSEFTRTERCELRYDLPCRINLYGALSAWWPGNGTGVDWVRGNIADPRNGATYADGAVSMGFQLGTGTSHVRVGPHQSIDLGTFAEGFSVEFWLNATSSVSTARRLLTWRDGNTPGLSLEHNGSNGTLTVVAAGQNFSVGGFPANQGWRHVVVTHDAAKRRLRIYRDGNLVFDQAVAETTRFVTSGELLIGGLPEENANRRFIGGIDEVSLYVRALTSFEVYTLHGSGAAGKCPPDTTMPEVSAGPDRVLTAVPGTVRLLGEVTNAEALKASPVVEWAQMGATSASIADPTSTETDVEVEQPGFFAFKLSATDGLAIAEDIAEVRVPGGTAAEIPAGLVAWWPGNASPYDVVQNLPFMSFNGLAYAPGKVGQGFSFDGVNDFAVVESPVVDVGAGEGSFSVEFWINPSAIRFGRIFEWANGVHLEIYNAWCGINCNTPRIRFGLVDVAGITHFTEASPWPTNAWTHVVCTYDRSTGASRIYLNGLLQGSGTPGSVQPQTSGRLTLGSAAMVGVIDEFSLYNVALDPEQVGMLHAAGSNGKGPFGAQAPSVDAGPDLVGHVGAPLPLHGEVSAAVGSEGRSMNILWSVVSGPEPVSFQPENEAESIAIFSTPGLYILRLAGDDGVLATSDLVEVRVDSAHAAPPPSSLAAWWTGNSTAIDVVRQLPMTRFNGLGYASGKVGQGFAFDGVDDIGIVDPSPATDVGAVTGSFSVEFWINPQALRNGRVFEWRNGVYLEKYDAWCGIGCTTPRVRLGVPDGNGVVHFVETSAWATNAWSHFVGTYDHTTGVLRMYLNGVMRSSVSVGSFMPATSGALALGGSAMIGVIDEFALYTEALSHEKVESLFLAGSIGKGPPGSGNLLVNAGSDRITEVGVAVDLRGTVVSAGASSGVAVDILWTLVHGPGTAVFSAQDAAETAATFTAEGVYLLKLSANDGRATVSDTVEVRVGACAFDADSSLVAWWTGNGTSEDRIQGLKLQRFGGTGYATGQVGMGFAFDGSDDTAEVGATPALNVGVNSGSFSVEFWIKPSAIRNGRIFQWANGVYLEKYDAWCGIGCQTPRLRFNIVSSTGSVSSVESVMWGINVWTHVVCTYDKSTGLARIYLNGVLRGSASVGSVIPATAGNLVLGGSAVVGVIDEFSLYDRALGAEDIGWLGVAGALGKCPAITNQSPEVEVAAVGEVVAGEAVSLLGVAVDDGLPNPPGNLTYQWKLVSGPGEVSLSAPDSLSTDVVFSQAGLYLIEFSADDSELVGAKVVTISVREAPPPNPVVAITHPVDGAHLVSDRPITLRADATISAGVIERVEFYRGANLLGVVTAPSLNLGPSVYTLLVPGGFPAGGHVLSARAIALGSGATTTSPPVNVTAAPYTGPEAVELLTPLDGDRITAPVEFTGIVARAGLELWKLEYRLTPANPNASDASAPWTTFANGTEYAGTPASGDDPAIPASLGTFDPTLLLNGLYQVRLSATSTNGTTLYDFVRTVLVDGKLKLGVIESTVVDLEVPAPGFPLRVERHYSSANLSSGDFGPGTTLASSAVRLQLAQELGANWFGYLVSGPLGVPLYRVDPVPPEDATGVPPMPRVVAITLPDQTVLRFEPDLTPKQQIVPISEANVFFRPLAGTTGTLVPLDSSLAPNTEVLLSNVTGDLDLLDVETGTPLDPAAYRLTTLDGTEYIIDAGGSLLSQRDPNGNSITYTHDAIIHSNGLRLDITRDTAGRITRVTDPAGRQVNYAYDASGRLISVTDASGHATTYGYVGGSSLVVSVQPPAAIRPTYNAFDALNRFVGRVDAMLGETRLDYDSAAQTKTLRDALGHETVYRYDLLGNVTSITNPLGHVTAYEFGDSRFPDKPTRVTNHLGESVRTTYNAQGRTATVTDPLGRVTSYVYDSAGRLLSETDALGHAVTRTYDAKGNVLTVTDRGGGVTSYTYDAAGNPLTVTDALNNVSTFTYNSQGLPLTETETDSAGVVLVDRSFTYDLAGNLLAETIQQTGPDGVTRPRVTAYTHDAAGRVRTITHPDGRVVSRTYTDSGQLATETTPEHGFVTYAYDAADRMIRVTHADGATELTGYDALGHVTSRTDRGGFTSTYVYDAAGRLTSETLPDGGVISRVYDAAGRVTSETDDAGRVTATTYDAAGNPTGITHPDGTTTALTYDAVNNVATRSVRAFAEPEFAALGGYARSIAVLGGRPDSHRLAQAGGGGGTPVPPGGTPARLFRFTYDANHRLTEVIHPDGVTRATLEYDFLGRPTRVTNERGAVWTYEYQGGSSMRRTRVTGPEGYVENYEYDAYANITAQTDARGRRVETSYEVVKPVRITFRDIGEPTFTSILNTYDDATGRLSTVRDRRSFETRFTYIDPNKPDREIIRSEGPSGAGQSHRTREEYDSRGNLVKVTDARGSATAYEYDAFNRRTLVTHPDGVKERTVYGPGNTVARTELVSSAGDVLTTAYSYDANGRLSSITYPDATAEQLSFDADGRVTGRVDERGNATTYVYDDIARTVTVIDAELGVTRHAFDAVGNLLETTDARGHRTAYVYDLLGRLTARTEAAATNVARATRFEYDLNGNVVTRIEAADTDDERITRYTYDSDDRLLLTTFADGTTVRTERDADGNLLARTDERGLVTRSTYDAFGRLTSLTDPLGRATTYGYPDFGAWAVRTDPLGRVFTDHFDERQRLVRREFDGGAWTENLAYDAFGRLAERGERRAASVSSSAARVTAYAYDARGRVSTITHPSGGVDRFTYDDAGNIGQLTDPRGFATTFRYDRLNRRVSETRYGAAGESHRTTAFEYDPVGNLTRLTKPGGQIVTRTYDQLNRPQVVTATLNATDTYSRTLLHDVFDRLYATEDDRGRHEFTYDLRDRLRTEKDPLGHTRSSTYDPAGNRLTATDERGFTASFTYDALDRVVAAILPGGTGRAYEFDAAGRLVLSTSSGAGTAAAASPDRVTRFGYDGLDRVVLTEQLAGIGQAVLGSESAVFDGEGRLLSRTDGEGHVTLRAYSAEGFLASVTFPGTTTRSYTHDVAGNVLTVTDELGHVTTTAYNGFGELASVTEPLGRVTTFDYDVEGRLARVAAPLGRVTNHDYDAAGRRIATRLPDGTSVAFAYDLHGNLTRRIDQAGRETIYTYDALDRLASASAPIDTTHRATATYTYDAAGNLTTITDPLGRVTRFEHDAAGRLATTYLPLRPADAHEIRTYDHSGNLVELTDGNGHVTRHAYDARGLLRSVRPDTAFGQPEILHGYDRRGLRTSMSDRFGVTSYAYDSRGRLTSKSTPYAGALSYGYDEAGRLTSLVSSAGDGVRMNYGYDDADRLVTATDHRVASGAATHYAYDVADRLVGQTLPSGLRTARDYDAMDRLLSIETRTSASPSAAIVESYNYTRTLTGQIASEFASTGRATTYAYDHSDRLVREIISGDGAGQNGTLDYTLDAIGNRLARASTVPGLPSQDFHYDANHAIEGYAYDDHGNPVSGAVTDAALPAPGPIADSYDFRHALAAREARATYLYDGDGERVGRRVWNPVAKAWDDTFYLNDSLPSAVNPLGLSQTLEERTPGGSLQRRYSPAPLRLAVAERHVLASSGGAFSVALAADGTVLAWGDNSAGQLGDGSALAARAEAAPVPGLGNITRVVAGAEFAAALRADGTLFWWGRLGALAQSTPTAFVDLPPLASVAAGADFLVALGTDGSVWTLGDNSSGQLGSGGFAASATPVQVSVLPEIVEVAAGAVHALALDAAGQVHAWGDNRSQQLGSPAYSALASTLPLIVPDLSGVIELSGGARHTLALDLSGAVHAWGDNSHGQLGDGTRTNRAAALAVAGLDQAAVSIASGGWHSLAALADGTVRAWGSHAEGQSAGALSAATEDQLTPAPVTGLSSVTRVTAGARQSFAQTASGEWYGWGSNREGQLGLVGTIGGAAPQALGGPPLVDLAGGIDSAPALAIVQALRYYGYDAQGSVRHQLDGAGAVTARYDYDAFGTLLGAFGESPLGSDAYLYRGERYDALTGLYHLRARDYDPALGRFHQIDDFAGFTDNPYSLNRYNYAESNPLGKFDPAGRFAVTSLVTAVYALHIKDQYLAELASAGPQFTFDPDEALNRYLMTDHLVAASAPLKLKERELWVRASGGGMIGSWVNESGSSQTTETLAGRGFGAGSDVFFLHQSGARFRQGWALRQVEQAWGALRQSRLNLNMGPRFPEDPRSQRIAAGNVSLKGARWADAIYADALLQATLRSATNEGRRGVRAHFTPTVEGRRYDATAVDLTARATTALNAASGGGPVDWESDLPTNSNRFLVSANQGALESPVVGEFAQAMAEATASDAYQFAYVWAQVGVSLPGEAGLMVASMVPVVGEGLDVHGAVYGETAFERWASRASLGISGITFGLSPNFGRMARFAGDTVDTMRGLKTSKIAAASSGSADVIRAATRATGGVVGAMHDATHLGRNAIVETVQSTGRSAPVPELKHLKCFVAGTLVKTSAGLIPIEQIKVGDEVWSRDEETGQEDWRPVLRLFETKPARLVHLSYEVAGEAGTAELSGTPGHPFWSVDREEWVPMGELKVGERLYVADGVAEAIVTALRVEEAPAGETFRTFNFEVAGWHTYFVAPKNSPPGSAVVWVHNLCDEGVNRLLRQIETKGARYGERVLDAIRGKLSDSQLRIIESAIGNRRLAPENAGEFIGPMRRGVAPIIERSSKSTAAQVFEDAASGAASDIATRNKIVPALFFDNPNLRGRNFVRFDGIEGTRLIDRKLNVTTKSKQVRDLRRMSLALKQNPGFQGVIQVPDAAAQRAAMRALIKADVTNITVEIAP